AATGGLRRSLRRRRGMPESLRGRVFGFGAHFRARSGRKGNTQRLPNWRITRERADPLPGCLVFERPPEESRMLYKVTPAMTSPEQAAAPAAPKKEKKVRGPRKKRKSAVYDAEGNEVLISLTCLKCKTLKPLAQFGLRKMGDGAIRNQPWCRGCRAGAGTKGKKPQEVVQATPAAPEAVVAPEAAVPATVSPVAP